MDAMRQEESSRRAFLAMSAIGLGGMLMPNRSSASAVLERRIPKSSEPLPAVGLGTWQAFDVGGDGRGMAEAKEALRAFVAEGGRVIDTSPLNAPPESVTGQLTTDLPGGRKVIL